MDGCVWWAGMFKSVYGWCHGWLSMLVVCACDQKDSGEQRDFGSGQGFYCADAGGSFLRISCVHNIWIAYRIYCGVACLTAKGFLQIYSRENWNSVFEGQGRVRSGIVFMWHTLLWVVDLILLQRSLIKRVREGKVRHCVCVACLRVGVLDLILLQQSLIKRVMKTRNLIVLPPVGVTITTPHLQREEEFKRSQFVVNVLHYRQPRPPKPVIAEMLIERLGLPSTCALYLSKF